MSLRKKQKKECSWETKKIFFICILIKRSCDASFWNRLPITTRTQKDFQQPKTHRQIIGAASLRRRSEEEYGTLRI